MENGKEMKMYDPKRLENGNLLVPMRAEDPKTGSIGDGIAEIGPDHPDFKMWDEWEKKNLAGGGEAEKGRQ